MPVFSKNFVLYLLFLATLYKINSFINPIFVERVNIPVTLIENTQHVESWDDGEVPWDVEEEEPEKILDTTKMWEYLYYNDKASLLKMLQDKNLSQKEKNYYWLFLAMLMNMNMNNE